MSFSVRGADLTTVARDFVLSGEFDKAEHFLVENLEGFTVEQARSVLSGAQRLAGVNSLVLEEDPDSDSYKEGLRYLYAGRRRFKNHGIATWWSPVAYWRWTGKGIVAFNRDFNTKHDNMMLKPRIGRMGVSEITSRRVRQSYQRVWVENQSAMPREIVEAVPWEAGLYEQLEEDPAWGHMRSMEEVLVFFEPCDAPPPWLLHKALRKTPFQSFLEAYQARRLLERKWNGEDEAIVIRTPASCQGWGAEEAPRKDPDYVSRAWPVWDGTGATTPQAPVWEPYDIESALERLAFEVSEGQMEHARRQILAQANDSGWLDLPWKGQVLKVPKGAFECWALRRTKDRERATPWKVMSGKDWKQVGDDPYHTDWMLGAGLEPNLWHRDKTLQDAAYKLHFAIQHPDSAPLPDMFRANVLVALTQAVVGQVVYPKAGAAWYDGGDRKVIVVPNLSPRYALALEGASLVISEAGGRLAHLSQVGMERGIPVLRLEDARQHLPEGTWVRVEAQSGEIEVVDPDAESPLEDFERIAPTRRPLLGGEGEG